MTAPCRPDFTPAVLWLLSGVGADGKLRLLDFNCHHQHRRLFVFIIEGIMIFLFLFSFRSNLLLQPSRNVEDQVYENISH